MLFLSLAIRTSKYFVALLIICLVSLSPHFVYAATPIIQSISPQFIQQGQITNCVINGYGLNSTVISVSGGDVFAVILKQDPLGNSLSIQFAVQPGAAVGDREIVLRNTEGQETRYPIKVAPVGAPTIESIYPNFLTLESSVLLRITGMGLINPVISTSSDSLLINSYRSYDDSVLYVSLSTAPNIAPGTYQIYLSTIGGQAQSDIFISTNNNQTDLLSADPSAPGIFSVRKNSENSNQVILEGTMFDPNPVNNTVTLLENINGAVTGRKIEIAYSNSNEIIVNLPIEVDPESTLSFAVSNIDGKSSNIKSFDLNINNSETISTENTNGAGATATNINAVANNQPQSSNIQQTNNSETLPKHDGSNVDKQDIPKDLIASNNIDKIEKPTNDLLKEPSLDINDKNIIQNIQSLSQYLFSSSSKEAQDETVEPSISEIKDPARLISSIEENKQIKNQAELIMLAIDEAKENKELTGALKKAEDLKTKVDELEKLINSEKQKQKPDQRKVAMYQKLLASANAESRSQTFSLLNNLLKYKPQLKNLLAQKPFDLAAVQPNIPEESIILQYVPTDEGLIIFSVDNKNLKTRINKNISKDILSREIQAYRKLFEDEIEKIKSTGRVTAITSWKNDKTKAYKNEIQPLKEKSVFLYNALIEPVEKEIADKKVIAIIANGWLRYLPFQSIAKLTKDGDLRFLVSDKSIVYFDSVVAISKNKPQTLSNTPGITVFANPDGTLVGANKEAEVITMLFNKTVKTLMQQPFNKSLINQLAKKSDILHLATHGYLDSSDINSSYLVSGKKVTGKNYVQEKLFLKDIYDLELNNSKLVVLSGCDTGKLGNLSNEPDDILGSLATAFRVAGANTIIASLWKAHDDATKIIMQSFYENLKAGVDKAEALRRAELKVKENPKYSHPLFWSLFSLIGDWR